MTVCGEKVTGVCSMGKCPHIKRCCPVVWDKYGKIKPQTNEEWLCNLSTEEKAKVLRRRTYGNSEDNESVEQSWVNWLKAKHEDNPPDIPNVPSWDKWLEGERTKCEYCDGNGVECELYGRSECPKTPKTEQEYIQTCTTEQLADLMSRMVGCSNCPIPKDGRSCMGTYSGCWHEIIKWLKQPHHESVTNCNE